MIQERNITVGDTTIHYLEAGRGDPILLLHCVPLSSKAWRNIIPHLSILGRCIVPDLIGFGQSGKPPVNFSIEDHIQYIEGFIEQLNLKNITLVMHGLGAVIGFDYAKRNEANCRGLVFYEAFFQTSLNDFDLSLPFAEQLHDLDEIEKRSQNGLALFDKMIHQLSLQDLNQAEIEAYRAPFTQEGSEKSIITYLKEIENKNSQLHKTISAYSLWLMQSPLPKLLLYSVPGFITTMATIMWAKENLPNLEIVDLGEELHLAQEMNAKLMGESISIWLQSVEQNIFQTTI